MMRSTPGYPPGGIRVPSNFSRVVQVFETQSRIAPTGQAATSRMSASTSKVPKRRVVATEVRAFSPPRASAAMSAGSPRRSRRFRRVASDSSARPPRSSAMWRRISSMISLRLSGDRSVSSRSRRCRYSSTNCLAWPAVITVVVVPKDVVYRVAKPEPLVAELGHSLLAGTAQPVVAPRCAAGSVAPLCLDQTLGAHTAQQGIDRPFTDHELAPGTQHLDHLSAIARHLLEHRQHAVLDDSFAKLCGKAKIGRASC